MRANVTALFGGVGGFELGLSKAGHVTSLFCESDPDAVSVLEKRFPKVPVALDIRRLGEVIEQISPRSNLLTAGFPCTDLSQAGRTRGFSGDSSKLVRQVMELLRRRPFANVLLENVPNWRVLHRGAYLKEVVEALERLGYKWAYRTIDVRAFGLPQRRLRIFLFATQNGDPRDVLFHGSHAPTEERFRLDEAAHGFYWTEGNRGLGWGEDCVPTLKGGSSIGIPAPPAILLPSLDLVTPVIKDAERLQGFPAGWTELDERAELVGGGKFQHRRRWLLVGNAVNVEVSRWLGAKLADRKPYRGHRGVILEEGMSWPTAAWSDGERRWKSEVSTWPTVRKRRSLDEFLSGRGLPLSARATAGFYRRIKASSLVVRPGFISSVSRHLRRMERPSLPN